MTSPTEITVARLRRLVGTPDAPYLLDVRIDEDVEDDPRRLPGARRHRFDDTWPVRRFVDPDARFLFVAPSGVMAVVERFGAEPFDVEGVRFGHRGADGERCTFDAMLEEFGLGGDALDRLATVVRAADTDRHGLAPEAAGLLAISVGLSRLHRDDLAQLEAGIGLYDALYRWARDGFDEGHDWPPARRT